jgi:hypothetical protein
VLGALVDNSARHRLVPAVLGSVNLPTDQAALINAEGLWSRLLEQAVSQNAAIIGYRLPELEADYLARMELPDRSRWSRLVRADLHESASLLADRGRLTAPDLGLRHLATRAGFHLPSEPSDWEVWQAVSAVWSRLAPLLRQLVVETPPAAPEPRLEDLEPEAAPQPDPGMHPAFLSTLGLTRTGSGPEIANVGASSSGPDGLISASERQIGAATTEALLTRLVEDQVVDPLISTHFSANLTRTANSVVGQWAERQLIDAFRALDLPTWKYGADALGPLDSGLSAERPADGETLGKRPDLLVGGTPGGDPSQSWFALEARSSAYRASADYATQKGRPLSITIKLEDVLPQTRWVLATGCPLAVVQLFLAPEAYVIAWNDVLRRCLTSKPILDRRSQKETFFIRLDDPAVHRLGVASQAERWSAQMVEAPDGKLEAQLTPAGEGRLRFSMSDLETLRSILAR